MTTIALGITLLAFMLLGIAKVWQMIFRRRMKKELSLDSAFGTLKEVATITLLYFQGFILLVIGIIVGVVALCTK